VKLAPEISVKDLAVRLRSEDTFVLLDVREPWEVETARIQDPRLQVVPMSSLGTSGLGALPAAAQSKDAEMMILCHHGSAACRLPVGWLLMAGRGPVSRCIDAYAARSIGLWGARKEKPRLRPGHFT
jgi:rhodanese-related sulfurtransferase